MKTPKSTRGLLKLLIDVAENGINSLDDSKLSKEDWHTVMGMITGIQNDLGEMQEILEKFGLQYRG